MGLFSVVIKSRNNQNNGRFMFVFSDWEKADEWWRTVSSFAPQDKLPKLERITPQFYVHRDTEEQVRRVIDSSYHQYQPLLQFADHIMITRLLDRDSHTMQAAVPQEVTDRRSHEMFYIRSKVTPYRYWCLTGPADNNYRYIGVSSTRRTRFQVRLLGITQQETRPRNLGNRNQDPSELYRDMVMIGSDVVGLYSDNCMFQLSEEQYPPPYLTPAEPAAVPPKPRVQNMLYIGPSGGSRSSFQFRLNELKLGCFHVVPWSRATNNAKDELQMIEFRAPSAADCNPTSGEIWELFA